MPTKKVVKILCLILFLLFVSNGSVFAVGFDNGFQGIRGLSMGTAFTGVADDATAIFYNPAGLSKIKNGNWDGEFMMRLCFSNFKHTDASGSEHISEELFPIPGFYVSRKFDKLAAGFGMYVPYGGGGVKYEHLYDGFEFMAGLSALSGSISYQITPNFSLGLTPSIYYGQMENNIGAMNYEAKWEGIAGYGVSIGAMYNFSEKLSLGATIRSPVSVSIDGTETIGGVDNDSEIEYDLPAYYAVGIGYQIRENLLLSADFVFTPWSYMDETTITTEGDSSSHDTGNQDTIKIAAGMEYKANQKLDLRSGLMYETGASEDSSLTFSSCDIERVTLTFGVGYDITKSIEADVGAFYVMGIDQESNGAKYDQDHFDIQLGVRFNF